MAGLLDFFQTPAGMGLLAGLGGYAAGARRGTPVNNLGRGAVAGLTGYNYALNQQQQDAENALSKQFKELQMAQLKDQIDRQKALREAATGAVQDATGGPKYTVGGQTFSTPEQAQASAQNMFTLPSGAVPGNDAPMMGYDKPDPSQSLVDLSGGQVPQVTQQPTPDMRSAMYNRLMQAGFPEQAANYAPKWTVGERYNTTTGLPEKVLYDEYNPTNAKPFGGTQADTIVADNLGGQTVYRGSHSATPMGSVQRTASPDALLTDARTRSEGAANRAVTMRGQNLTDARARITDSKAPAGYRYKPNGDLEMIPGGPADQKTQQQQQGGETVSTIVGGLRDMYHQLNDAGAITSTQNRAGTNLGAGIASSGMGQAAGRLFGTQSQSLRNTIAQQRPILLQAIMRSTGMSAKQMDSNAELKLYLSTATDPTLDFETNMRALDTLEKLYGIGGGRKAASAPPSAPKVVDFGSLK